MASKSASKRRAKSRRSSAKPPSSPSRRRKPTNRVPRNPDASQNIRVRMYRVGFGDCFLLSFPVDGTSAHILIVHSQGDIGTMQQIVEDVANQTDKRLALVVATHRHQDHISGFGRYEREFKQFKVGEVWLPWTEDPKDAQAKQLKEKHFAVANLLQENDIAEDQTSP